MAENSRVIRLAREEHGLLINGLDGLRKDMEEQGEPTGEIEDLLLRVLDAAEKNGKRWQDREAR